MNKFSSDAFLLGLKKAGINFVCYLPESWLYEVYKNVVKDKSFTCVPVENESTGILLCMGAWMGGKKPVMIMENSGINLACESLSRLITLHHMPILMLASNRGEIGDSTFWSQSHRLAKDVLTSLRIPFEVITKAADIESSIVRAKKTMDGTRFPVALFFGERAL